MASVVRMPSVLAGATEAAISNWLVAPGDTVAIGDPIAEIETEKALVEYTAEDAGIVGRLMLAAGDSGEIGEPILVLVGEGETDADIDAALGGAALGGAAASAASAASPVPRRPVRARRGPTGISRVRPARNLASSLVPSSGRSPRRRAST